MDSKHLKVLFVFALVYAALYALGIIIEPLQDWNFSLDFSRLDYTLYFLPIAGFFFVYLLVPWMREELGFGNTFLYIFPALLAVFSYAAFVVAVYYYFGNQASLSGVDISLFRLDYFSLFLQSSYIYFVLAGIGGWAARMLIENFDELPKEKGSGKKSRGEGGHEISSKLITGD